MTVAGCVGPGAAAWDSDEFRPPGGRVRLTLAIIEGALCAVLLLHVFGRAHMHTSVLPLLIHVADCATWWKLDTPAVPETSMG